MHTGEALTRPLNCGTHSNRKAVLDGVKAGAFKGLQCARDTTARRSQQKALDFDVEGRPASHESGRKKDKRSLINQLIVCWVE